MNTLTRKGYGRIYTETEENVEQIKHIIMEIDPYEFGYLPRDLITTFDHYPEVVYTHKFNDLDMDGLAASCWKRGIKMWVFDAGYEEFPTDNSI